MSLLPERILVAVDTVEGSRHVVRVAAELAAALDAELHLVHVRITRSALQGRPFTPAQRERSEGEGGELLDELTAEAERAGRAPVELHLRLAERHDRELVEVQKELGALLVIGAGREGSTARRIFGAAGAAPGTVRRAAGAVLVVRDPAE